jgi:hypothetical protein
MNNVPGDTGTLLVGEGGSYRGYGGFKKGNNDI